MASKKKAVRKVGGPGRPQLYPLTAAQVARVERMIGEGVSSTKIQEKTGYHEFAILRVRRNMA